MLQSDDGLIRYKKTPPLAAKQQFSGQKLKIL